MENSESKPTIVTSVTLGKELHAGHLLLLATADLLQRGVGCFDSPIVLVNNNTGPRAAGAVLALSKKEGISIEDSAIKLSRGQVPLETVVDSYRRRIEDSELLSQASQILDEGNIDIFATTAQIVTAKLGEAGFSVEVVSEGANLPNQRQVLAFANPVWAGSGFNFVQIGRSIKILEKAGQLTATGKGVVSLSGLASQRMESQDPLLVFVDGSVDTIDAAEVFSAIPVPGRALQLPGAGIGFGGKIASGSKGEALTLTEVMDIFNQTSRPVTLSEALRQFVLTQPMTLPNPKMPDLATAFYNFKDNPSFINAIISSAEVFLETRGRLLQTDTNLQQKVGLATQADSSLAKWLQFLPERLAALKNTSAEDVVRGMRKSSIINPKTEQGRILAALIGQGFSDEEAAELMKEYTKGERALVMRGNPFFVIAETISRNSEKIESLCEKDYLLISETLQFCRERLGYV